MCVCLIDKHTLSLSLFICHTFLWRELYLRRGPFFHYFCSSYLVLCFLRSHFIYSHVRFSSRSPVVISFSLFLLFQHGRSFIILSPFYSFSFLSHSLPCVWLDFFPSLSFISISFLSPCLCLSNP
jgi:hypothetical protein